MAKEDDVFLPSLVLGSHLAGLRARLEPPNWDWSPARRVLPSPIYNLPGPNEDDDFKGDSGHCQKHSWLQQVWEGKTDSESWALELCLRSKL